MNPASHLLIAAPCYFTSNDVLTFLLSFPFFPPLFSLSFLFSEEKVSSFHSIYLESSLHATRSRDRWIFFPLSLPNPSPKNVGAFNGNFEDPLFPYPSIKYRTENCFERWRTRIDFPVKFSRPGWALRKTYSNRGTRRGIKCRRVPLQRGSAMFEPLALKIHNSGEIWYFPPRPLCATYFRKLFLPQKCLENA